MLAEQLDHLTAEGGFLVRAQGRTIAVAVEFHLLFAEPAGFAVVALFHVGSDVLALQEGQRHLAQVVEGFLELSEGEVFGAQVVVQVVGIHLCLLFHEVLQRVVGGAAGEGDIALQFVGAHRVDGAEEVRGVSGFAAAGAFGIAHSIGVVEH